MNRNMKNEPKITVMRAKSISPYIKNMRCLVSL